MAWPWVWLTTHEKRLSIQRAENHTARVVRAAGGRAAQARGAEEGDHAAFPSHGHHPRRHHYIS
jgi:hypothetical protein